MPKRRRQRIGITDEPAIWRGARSSVLVRVLRLGDMDKLLAAPRRVEAARPHRGPRPAELGHARTFKVFGKCGCESRCARRFRARDDNAAHIMRTDGGTKFVPERF